MYFCLMEELAKLPDVFCLRKKGYQNSLCFYFYTWRTYKTPIGPVYFWLKEETAKLPDIFYLRKKGFQNSLCFCYCT